MKGERVRVGKLFVGLLVVGVLVGGCGGDDAPEASSGGDESGSVTLTAADFAFSPADLSAGAGDTIEFTNEDDAEHSFTIDNSDVDADVDGGASTTVDLGSLEAGSYDFYCKYHKDSMTGTLEVTE